jgi:hypothetical protein
MILRRGNNSRVLLDCNIVSTIVQDSLSFQAGKSKLNTPRGPGAMLGASSGGMVEGNVPSSQTPSILLLLHDDLLRGSLLILHWWALLVVLLLRGAVVALGRAILVAVAGEVSG